MAKVIGQSNFDNPLVDDILICDNLEQKFAAGLAKEWNDSKPENTKYYYLVVADDYKLYKFEIGEVKHANYTIQQDNEDS